MKEINVEELQALLKQNPNLKVIDVREEGEYEEYNLNTPLLPLSKIRYMEIESIEQWKDKDIVLFCKGGVRSKEACLLLKTFGFASPINLLGGITAWKSAFADQKIG